MSARRGAAGRAGTPLQDPCRPRACALAPRPALPSCMPRSAQAPGPAHRLKGVHRDARVCAVPRGVHIVVAPPVPPVAPVHLGGQAVGQRAGGWITLQGAAALAGHALLRVTAQASVQPNISKLAERDGTSGPHPAVDGHQRVHVVPVLHQRLGQPVLACAAAGRARSGAGGGGPAERPRALGRRLQQPPAAHGR